MTNEIELKTTYFVIRDSNGGFVNDILFTEEKSASSFRNETARDAHVEPISGEEALEVGGFEDIQ